MNEVYVRRETLPFVNWAEHKRRKMDSQIFKGDKQYKFLLNALFMPLDMTDHEEAFVGFDEYQGEVPLSNVNWIQRWNTEKQPQTDAMPNLNKTRENYHPGTGPTMQMAMNDKYAEVDPPEYDVYGAEDDEDGDDDEDYDEEEDEDDYGEDYGEDYGAEDPYIEEERIRAFENAKPPKDGNFLRANDDLFDKYTTNELDQFMRLLNIRPMT